MDRIMLHYSEEQYNRGLELVSYGIGKINQFRNAQYQLALLICLIKRKQIRFAESNGLVTFKFFDPMMSVSERNAVTSFGGVWIEINEEGKRKVSYPTLFFMPHCGRALYNNVLWANWGRESLHHVMIIGNSFNRYMDQVRPTRRGISDSDPLTRNCIELLFEKKLIIEEEFKNDFEVVGALNDFCIHTFDTLNSSKQIAWENRPQEYFPNGTCDTIIGAAH